MPTRRPSLARARPGEVTLARALSKLGLASRKEAAALIAAGRVRVNGTLIRHPARIVVPERVSIAIDEVARHRVPPRVVLLHKPRGVVTTRRDPEGRRTVFDLLGPDGAGLVAVGRLDLASTGLLLFTSDTQLAHRLTDPVNRVPRTYVVTVRGRVSDETAAALTAGLDVPGAGATIERLAAARVEIRKSSARETHAIVTLTEGRNREIRRLFQAAGHEVTRLHRVAFGAFTLGAIAPGDWRVLSADEIARLR